MRQGDSMPLSGADTATPLPDAESPDGGMKALVCMNCHHAYRPGELACSHCGVLLAEGVNTTRMADEQAPAPKRAPIGAVFVEDQKPIIFAVDGIHVSLPKVNTMVIG